MAERLDPAASFAGFTRRPPWDDLQVVNPDDVRYVYFQDPEDGSWHRFEGNTPQAWGAVQR